MGDDNDLLTIRIGGFSALFSYFMPFLYEICAQHVNMVLNPTHSRVEEI